jgi:drug/metabolite transporter (DMT)-like permease
MERNVGATEKLGRVAVGAVLLVVGVVVVGGMVDVTPVVGVLAALAGAILAVTGLTQSCPIYSSLGVNRCEEA